MKASQREALQKQYVKHKEAIAKRLEEFKKRKTEKELFQELCFCLLAANTSSRMALRVMENVGDIIFTGTEEQIRDRLHALHCRFYRKRAEYIFRARTISLQLEREYLVKNIKGFGYKESSHFLRNIGHSNYAILDKHVLRAMQEYGLIKETAHSLNKKTYLYLEKKLQAFSKRVKIPMDELDFVLWSRKSGEILK